MKRIMWLFFLGVDGFFFDTPFFSMLEKDAWKRDFREGTFSYHHDMVEELSDLGIRERKKGEIWTDAQRRAFLLVQDQIYKLSNPLKQEKGVGSVRRLDMDRWRRLKVKIRRETDKERQARLKREKEQRAVENKAKAAAALARTRAAKKKEEHEYLAEIFLGGRVMTADKVARYESVAKLGEEGHEAKVEAEAEAKANKDRAKRKKLVQKKRKAIEKVRKGIVGEARLSDLDTLFPKGTLPSFKG